jgi:hypothetical protein
MDVLRLAGVPGQRDGCAPKPVRERDRNHLVCGRGPSDAHQIKFAEQRAMGRKVSDKFTVPVCRLHHRELHRRGDERAWWQTQGIDPLPIAAAFWVRTHAVGSAAADVAGEMNEPTSLDGEQLTNEFATPSNVKMTKRSQLFARRWDESTCGNTHSVCRFRRCDSSGSKR